MKKADILLRDDLAQSRAHFERACMLSLQHADLAADALARYGDHGPLISCVVRDHFPIDVKNELRRLAKACSAECDAARSARPRRTRESTILTLSRAVAASMPRRGFYGPMP